MILRLKGDLKETTLVLGSVLCAPGEPIEHVYFPLSGMVSLLTVMKSGEAIETAIIGREGVVGTDNNQRRAIDKSSDRANAGTARRVAGAKYLDLYQSSATFRTHMNQFQQLLLIIEAVMPLVAPIARHDRVK